MPYPVSDNCRLTGTVRRFRRSLRRITCGRILAAAALVAAAHAPSPAPAADLASLDRTAVKRSHPLPAPVVKEAYETYDVCGSSIPELRAGLGRNGIRMSDGNTYDALAAWQVWWEYDYDRSVPGACRVDDFRAFVDVTIRYPNWATDSEVHADLADAWDSYLHSLIRHEQGHRDIAVEAAEALTRAVAALPPSPTCADVDQAVAALGRTHLQRLRRNQLSYDAKTDHGALQGAVLPEI